MLAALILAHNGGVVACVFEYTAGDIFDRAIGFVRRD
jgi:hypothetical protein